MIYFARLATGAIKIGTAVDPRKRIRGLVSVYDTPVILLKTLPGGPEEERAIHQRFAHLRLGKKEQFRPGPDLLEFIGVAAEGWPDPRKVWAQPFWDEIGLREIGEQIARNRQQTPGADTSKKDAARKARDIQIGGVYKVSIRGRWTDVRVLRKAPEGKKGWIVLNSATGRTVHIRWAYQLRTDAELAAREAESARYWAEFRRASDELKQAVEAKRQARAAKGRRVPCVAKIQPQCEPRAQVDRSMSKDESVREWERFFLGDTSRDRRYNAVWDRVCARGDRLTVAQAIAHFGRHELERAMDAGWIFAGYPCTYRDRGYTEKQMEGRQRDHRRYQCEGLLPTLDTQIGYRNSVMTLGEAKEDMVLWADEPAD